MRFFRHFLWIIAALAFAGWYWLQPHSRAHGTTEASNWLTKETLEQISATRIQTRDQIRTVIQTFRDRLFTEIFPGRTTVPKTLIFAKDDSHADHIAKIVREEFGKRGGLGCITVIKANRATKPGLSVILPLSGDVFVPGKPAQV